MKGKLLTLFTLVVLLTAFSIPLVQGSASMSVAQNTVLSPIAKAVPDGGSIVWQVQVNNAIGQSIAVSSNESYIYVGGANWTDPTNSSTWVPILWKYNNSGSFIWNNTLNVQGPLTSVFGGVVNGFSSVALSPDNSSVYAAGEISNGSSWYPILVKFNASDGSYLWNYNLSGESYSRFYAVEVSPDSGTVYLAGMLFKSGSPFSGYNSSFYVSAINSSDGALKWEYELYFVNGTYNLGYARDLALSPSGGVLYASGFFTSSNLTKAIDFVAIDTSSHQQLWNMTLSDFGPIDIFDISSDGNEICTIGYSLSNLNLITVNTSNENITGNSSISNTIYPQTLSLSFNESNLYVSTSQLQAYGQNLPALMVELNFSGTVTGVLISPNRLISPYGLAPSNDNQSAYIVGSIMSGNTYSMLLLKGEAGPIPPPSILLLLSAVYLLNQGLSPRTSYIFAGVGIGAALVIASFLIVRTMRGKRVKNV
jgi:hypothetical protein